MRLTSQPPHDFYLALDVEDYWEAEHDPEEIITYGFVRPLSLSTRDVVAVVRWNEEIDEPWFDVAFPQHTLTASEANEARQQLQRVLGVELPIAPLMAQAADDVLLGPLLTKHYGFKRLARATLWEECVDDFVRSRIRHRPTARRMSQDVRRTWGSTFVVNDVTYYGYPRPETVRAVDPDAFREFGIARRKGEYIVGLAQAICDGAIDLGAIEAMAPDEFFEQIQQVRGIGPATAQGLMHFRARPDCTFPSLRDKKTGEERGMRRWFMRAYGLDPATASDADFAYATAAWAGYEAMALRFIYIDHMLNERKR